MVSSQKNLLPKGQVKQFSANGWAAIADVVLLAVLEAPKGQREQVFEKFANEFTTHTQTIRRLYSCIRFIEKLPENMSRLKERLREAPTSGVEIVAQIYKSDPTLGLQLAQDLVSGAHTAVTLRRMRSRNSSAKIVPNCQNPIWISDVNKAILEFLREKYRTTPVVVWAASRWGKYHEAGQDKFEELDRLIIHAKVKIIYYIGYMLVPVVIHDHIEDINPAVVKARKLAEIDIAIGWIWAVAKTSDSIPVQTLHLTFNPITAQKAQDTINLFSQKDASVKVDHFLFLHQVK